MSGNGTSIGYIRSTFAPEDGRCMCLFEAQSEDDVRRLNDDAGLPYDKVVEALDLTQNFTLKAFLEHRTLTLSEHDRIFRLPRHESYQIFESLGNRHLIEAEAVPAATPQNDDEERSEIAEELRYRLSPLLVGAIINHLRARNIVH